MESDDVFQRDEAEVAHLIFQPVRRYEVEDAFRGAVLRASQTHGITSPPSRSRFNALRIVRWFL